MSEFVKIEPFGELKIDKILFEGADPILFTCKSSSDNLFLAVCCTSNNEMKKWLLTSIDVDSLIGLLSDKITIRDAFLYKTTNKYSVILQNDKYDVIKNNSTDWSNDSKYLPSIGEFMDAEEEEFEEEIRYFRSMQNQRSEQSFKYSAITNRVDFKDMEFDESKILDSLPYNFNVSDEIATGSRIKSYNTMYLKSKVAIKLPNQDTSILKSSYANRHMLEKYEVKIKKQSQEYRGDNFRVSA